MNCQGVRRRIRQCLQAVELNAASFRHIVTGIFIAVTMGDVILYLNLRTSVEQGQLPWYIIDVLIMTMGLLEALLAPFWWYLGRWRLRCLIFITSLASVFALTLLALPDVPISPGSEFCVNSGISNPATFTGMTSAARGRLAIIIIVAIINVICKSGVWNISITLLDQADTQAMSLNFGIYLAARVVTLIMIPRLLSADMATWTQVLGVFSPLLLHIFQLYRLKEPTPQEDKDEREANASAASLIRILSSFVAVGQILAASLLAAALWGYMWHQRDIIKMLFYINEPTDFVTNQSDLLYYHALFLAVITYGMYYGRPAVFDKVSALKLASFTSLIVIPLYCVQTMLLTCETGLVAGLNQNYTQPSCSSNCGCAVPYSVFAPVCVPDTMTTYMSPCHAGCTGLDTVAGLPAYRGCACASNSGVQRATVGACSVVQCRSAFILHKAITAVIVILTVLAVQAQMVLLLRSVRPADRPLAVGLSSAVALSLIFGGGHLAYFGIRQWSCAWSEGERCLFYTRNFLQATGGISASLAGVSAVITLTTWLIKRRNRVQEVKEDIPLSSRE